MTTYPSSGQIVSEPLGVVLIISTWNYPFRTFYTISLLRPWCLFFSILYFINIKLSGIALSTIYSVSYVILIKAYVFCFVCVFLSTPEVLSLDPVIGAIAAGNAVVLKPSEVAPATSSVLAKLLTMYMDTSAVRVVEGSVQETTALLEQKWDKIFYTGNNNICDILPNNCLLEHSSTHKPFLVRLALKATQGNNNCSVYALKSI